MKFKNLNLAMILSLAIFGSNSALADLLDFEFLMTAGSGSLLNLGDGPIDVSGSSFTLFGNTISDLDVFNGGTADDDVGMFAANLNFDFGISGLFSTSSSLTDAYYAQNCGSDTAISCAGIVNLAGSMGFLGTLGLAIAVSDADVGQALGSNLITAGTSSSGSMVFGNNLGQGLLLYIGSNAISEFSVTAAAVPAPEPLILLLTGFLATAIYRRVRAIPAA